MGLGENQIQLIIAVLTMVGSGFTCYLGVRLAIAAIRGDVKRHEEQIGEISDRLLRLERPFFEAKKHGQ